MIGTIMLILIAVKLDAISAGQGILFVFCVLIGFLHKFFQGNPTRETVEDSE